MNLKTCKLMMNLMYILCVLSCVAGIMLNEYLLWGVAVALLVIQAIFRYRFYRCPKCGAMLAKGNHIHCNECHWEELN